MNKKIPLGYKELKPYLIKTKITINEHRKRFSNGRGSFIQPLECYSYEIENYSAKTSCGGFKNKKELIKSLLNNLHI